MILFASLGTPIACLPHVPKTDPACHCECHRGIDVRHFIPCCTMSTSEPEPEPEPVAVKPKGQPRSTRGHEADRARRATRAGYSSTHDLLKMGVWLAEHKRVPSIDEIVGHVGVSIPTAYKWRRACADFLGVELPSSRWPKKGA